MSDMVRNPKTGFLMSWLKCMAELPIFCIKCKNGLTDDVVIMFYHDCRYGGRYCKKPFC